ncbi:MAG: type II secretion system protein GspL [Gammaproteobacteria bacterium]|jgi:general secretion pathway protein L|nr:type II secretion system protein GspL [Gammaproteobacteria bacterium]MDH3750739.1 type II secretion system protein GspL [Gammaproteobacteria bacterium]
MAEYLVIRLDPDRDKAAHWIAVDSNGTRISQPVTGPLTEATRDAADRAVIVLVPAANVLTTTVDIPVRGGSRLLAALPFALEEQLADDVENLHFAVGTRGDSGSLPVAVVAHEQMQGWLERLAEAGITASRVVAENQGLARIPGTLSLLVADEQIMFNDGADNEFVMQGVKPSDVLTVAGALDDASVDETEGSADDGSPGHLLVYCDPMDEERFQHDWIALRHELASVDINLLPDGVLPRLAVTVAADRGINLLQGRYGAKAEIGALFRPWRYAAVLILALTVVAIAGKGVDYYRLSQEETVLKEQFTQEYRQIRPDDTREVVDPVATVNSVRRGFGGPAAAQVFLPSLQQLAAALRQGGSVDIEAVSYRAGVIDVRLTAPDVATLDNIQRAVSDSGRFNASIQSTDQVGDKVSSRIQIRESGV